MLSAVDMDAATNPPLTVIETEAALLGALMIDNRFVERVIDLVSPEDFAEAFHQRLYATILAEVGQGRAATPPLLAPLLQHDPALGDLGIGYLGHISGSGAGLIGTRDFARQIREFAIRRRLLGEVHSLGSRLLTELDVPIADVVIDAENAIANALHRDEVKKSLAISSAWDAAMAEIEAEASGQAPPGLAVSGFDDWNSLTGNMRRGEVIILAGRPSMGKTAVALSTALATARAGWGTLFVSLEMSATELMKRAIADLIFEHGTSASFTNVQRGKLTAFDRDRIGEVRRDIETWPLIIRQDAGLRIGRLRLMIRREKGKLAAQGKSLDVVFVDYLGLLKADGVKVKRYEEVSEISRAVKELARELNVAIVMLAQLNREVEKREDKRPQLSDLRDSGDIEQDADVVMFVYREQYYLERSEPDQHDKKYDGWFTSMQAARDRVELIAAKVRNGRIGKRNCYFFAEHQAVRGSSFFSSRGHS